MHGTDRSYEAEPEATAQHTKARNSSRRGWSQQCPPAAEGPAALCPHSSPLPAFPSPPALHLPRAHHPPSAFHLSPLGLHLLLTLTITVRSSVVCTFAAFLRPVLALGGVSPPLRGCGPHPATPSALMISSWQWLQARAWSKMDQVTGGCWTRAKRHAVEETEASVGRACLTSC